MRGAGYTLDAGRNPIGISTERDDLDPLAERHKGANQLRRVAPDACRRGAECTPVKTDAEWT